MSNQPLNPWEFWHIISKLEYAREGFLQAGRINDSKIINNVIDRLIFDNSNLEEINYEPN